MNSNQGGCDRQQQEYDKIQDMMKKASVSGLAGRPYKLAFTGPLPLPGERKRKRQAEENTSSRQIHCAWGSA
ncbi:hypothetical protein CSA56_02905 [candidate division KSB3 bacterium]|uniref:Uncharacterized protein n=1 Tax=candidate division KSB3 bacterium TaxID=2044937 RepID=A0A2G6KJ85_9BACT|nr:MAG: hypothetical protein CSA56_02905 [candidate division KSB3 bacterium]